MENPKKNIQPETAKFRLVKFFAYTSFIILIISSFALSAVISQRATKVLMETYENYALLIAKNLNHQVFHYFVIPVTQIYGKSISLRKKEQSELMGRIVKNTLHSFNIETVNIYDIRKGQIAYSTDKDLIGLTGKGGIGYKAALQGKHSSGLISREPSLFGSWFSDFSKEKKLRTFTPFKAEPPFTHIGILGVFELTQDLTNEYESILRFKYLIFGVSLGVMILIFLSLLLVVRKAERILKKRAEESKRLQDQLNQAERLAVLGEMVAAVSHEIKNPLGIIRSTAEFLADSSASNDTQKRLSNIIIEESGRLNGIVTDFLDFARPRAPRFQDCLVDEIIERNLSFLKPELDKNKIAVYNNGSIEKKNTVVEADPELLYRAFLNVFINAIQSMKNGGILTVNIIEKNGNCRVEIQDTGEGISRENFEKIFSPFFTTKEKGSGLGLSIVKKILDEHKGSVWIKSEKGVGTKVSITLPLKTT